MEFGKIEKVSDLDSIDWRLPQTGSNSFGFLRALRAAKGEENVPASMATKFYLGTPAWGHKNWIGKIYPPKTKPADFLSFYAKSFNSIELNSSHYGIPNEGTVSKWMAAVGPDFLFCPKLLQQMSHYDQGLLDAKLQNQWFAFLESLQEKRGPCFAQFPPHFDYSKKAILFRFLEQWPTDFELALEFRHPSWFKDGEVLPALTEYLQKKGARGKGIGLVITDVAGRRDVLHASVSAPFTMLRFIGNDLHPTDFQRAKLWAERFSELSNAGMQRAFFFVHEPDDIHAPEMAQTIVQELNEEVGADLLPLQWCASE